MTTEPDPIDDAIGAHQPTLPTLELPDYHGRVPVGMRTSFTGTAGRITRPHTIGDRIVIVIEAKMKGDGHTDTDKGLMYLETLNVLDMFELVDDQGKRLLALLRSLYRTADDTKQGRGPIPSLGEVGYTDASGVVLTEAEVADLRGDPVRAILSPNLTPAVIVYDDGSREMWPDEFVKDTPRPRPGDTLTFAGGHKLVVDKLLNATTGEELPPPGEIPELPDAEDNAEAAAALAGEMATEAAIDHADEVGPFDGDLDDDAPSLDDE